MSFAPLAVFFFMLALFAVVGWALLRRARGLIALVRRLSEPAGVGELLSPATREALERAGHDPDALRPQSDLAPELRRLISADVARAFREVLVGMGGRGRPQPHTTRIPTPTPAGAMPTPPPPYAASDPGAGLRWAAAAAVVAAAAGALLLWR